MKRCAPQSLPGKAQGSRGPRAARVSGSSRQQQAAALATALETGVGMAGRSAVPLPRRGNDALCPAVGPAAGVTSLPATAVGQKAGVGDRERKEQY